MIKSTVIKSDPYAGNGVNKEFPFTFKSFSSSEVSVFVSDPDGIETEVDASDFSVALNTNQESSPGGTVTMDTAPATGYTLVVASNVVAQQSVGLRNQSTYHSDVIEAALDKLVLLILQLQEKVDRSAKIPITSTADANELSAAILVMVNFMTEIESVYGNISSVVAVGNNISDVSSVADALSYISAVQEKLTEIIGVYGKLTEIDGVYDNLTAVNGVYGALDNIAAALADLPSLSSKVSKTGDTMTGPLAVPSLTVGGNAISANGGISFRNRIINGNFRINQRGVSGTVTLAAGAYGHDRWKAGSAGCTYTFASSGIDTIITITSGNLQQVIESLNVEGGDYVMSWYGTAQGKIGSGSYSASGVTASGVTANANLTVEFGTGTVSRVQLECGGVATGFERRAYGAELALCQRYLPCFNASAASQPIGGSGFAQSSTQALIFYPLQVTPRIPPTGIVVPDATKFFIGSAASSGSLAANSITFLQGSLSTVTLSCSVSGLTPGQGVSVVSNASGAQIQFTGCEL